MIINGPVVSESIQYKQMTKSLHNVVKYVNHEKIFKIHISYNACIKMSDGTDSEYCY